MELQIGHSYGVGRETPHLPVPTGVTDDPSARHQMPLAAPGRDAAIVFAMSKIAGRIGGQLAGGGRLLGLADCKVPRRRENSMGTRKIVILRKNRNSGGAKILFFAKSRFRMISVGPKNGATGTFRAL